MATSRPPLAPAAKQVQPSESSALPWVSSGIEAGVAGAAVVAVFFLVVDWLAGRPLWTPHALGSALFLGARPDPAAAPETLMILAYTAVHGVVFMGGFSWLQRDAKIHAKPPAGLWGAPLLGLTFGLGWAPCIGPTYSAVQLLSLSGGSSAAKGALLAFVYRLGLGVPFLLIALAVRRGMGVMSFFRKHRLAIQRIGGGILILLGILMATGVWGHWVTELQYWFQTDVKLPI